MELSALFETCFVIIALMLVGFFGARRGAFPAGFSKAVSSLIVNIFLVATIFRSIASGAAGVTAGELPHVLLIICLAIGLAYVLGRGTLALFGKKYGADASMELSISVMNNLLIGLPVLDAIYGPTAVLFAGLTSLPFNLLLYTYGVWRLEPGEKAGGGLRLKEMLSPCVISTLLALVFFVLQLPVPGALDRLFSAAAACSMPLSMIVIGITMGSEDLRAALRDRRVYLIALVRLVLAPALTWLLLGLLTDNAMLLKSCVVVAGCPTGIVVPILTLRSGRDAALASNSVIVTTLLSLITLPALLMLLG